MQILSSLHIAAVIFSFGVIMLADKQAFSWIRGKQVTLDPKRLHLYHLLTWVGLLVLVVTGVIMLWPRADYLLRQPLLIMKMLFVGILLVNAILIGRLMNLAVMRSFASLSKRELIPLFASGAFSMIGWVGALVVAIAVFK